jgi:hypothetical protein
MYIPQSGCPKEYKAVVVVTVHIGPFRHAPPSLPLLPSVPSPVCYVPALVRCT